MRAHTLARATRPPAELAVCHTHTHKFGGLIETMDEAIQYRLRTPYDHDGKDRMPVIIAGPTCDEVDVLYRNCGYTLPEALSVGDKIEFLSTGAYTSTYCSVGFNGLPPLQTHCI